MTGIPQTFLEEPANSIATYDWLDIAEGIGYKTFYGFSTDAPSSVGESQYLTTSSLYSRSIIISGATTTGLMLSGSYSTTFNLPKNVRGNAYVSFGWFSNTNDMFPFVNIYRRVGSVDTLIATASGALVANAAQDLPMVTTLVLPILTSTHFSTSDVLVVQPGIQAAAGGAGAYSNIGQDPQNRDSLKIKPSTQAVTTKMIFNCPFQLDQ